MIVFVTHLKNILYLRWLPAGLVLSLPVALSADPAVDASPKAKVKSDKTPQTVLLSDDPATAMKRFSVTPGLKLDLFASEPLIQDVVNFCFDEHGRVYVVETGRRRTSVYDIRKHKDWLDSDLSFRTVEDRINFFRKTLTPENKSLPGDIIEDRNGDGKFDWHDLEVESERIRLVEDTDDDGHADRAVTFADGFNTLVSGVAAGVLAHKDTVWFTCIPDLWLLRDTTGKGVADFRKKLHSGFGVHIAYGGHDMHGLKFGPDGKLYWSIADRGFAPPPDIKGCGFTTEFLRRTLPDCGAVYRCELDGSNLEVVAVGLRNPQELAFDQFGNLFTGDNNADGGDKARWEYIVEGGDYGWRIGWQHLSQLGAWNSEMLWGLAASNTAACLLPPVAHISHGPAGCAYYPGTGMPERFNDHFFLADFPGGVRYFQVKPQGATFTVDNPGEYLQNNQPDNHNGKLIWSLYPTDVDFGPGGGAYVLDWVSGWEKTGKGRLYRLHDPAADQDPATLETKKLLAGGMEHRPVKELAALLGHRDQRVRQAAQFALAGKGPAAARTLIAATAKLNPQPARIHALWAIGQIGRQSPDTLKAILPLLRDADAQVRAQSANILGDARFTDATAALVSLLADAEPRVRFFAAQSLARLGRKEALEPVLAMLRANSDQDAYLRHAGAMVLVNIADKSALLTAAEDKSAPIRLAALLSMRRLEMPEVALFLNDPDPRLVLEAARAINDTPINAAMPQLASLLSGRDAMLASLNSGTATRGPSQLANFTLRRAINANFRLGKIENASSLVTLAADKSASDSARVEALQALGDWAAPSGRDRITGLWRPLEPREARAATIPLRISLEEILKNSPDPVRIAAIQAAARLALTDAAPAFHQLVADTQLDAIVRVEALRALVALKDARLPEAVKMARADKAEALRKEASRLLGQGDAGDAVTALATTLENGSPGEQQTALQTLATIKGKEADTVIRKWLDQLIAGKLPAAMQLDLLEAAAKRSSPSIQEKLHAFESARDKNDPLTLWRECLIGGDAKAGREIFFERAEAGCFRCHKVKGEGGDVGPDLTGIATRQTRDYILDSILFPNHKVAPGFETLTVTLKNGTQLIGLVKNENEQEVLLNSPEDGLVKVPKADIMSRAHGLSAMPEEMGKFLTKQDLRNLVEFLGELK